MRRFLCLLALAVSAGTACAQEQEDKLIDRLLRPNIALANSAQDKKFVAAEGASVDKKFVATPFYTGEEKATKSFWGLKSFFSRAFGTKKFSRAEAAANARTNAEIAFASTEFVTRKSSLVRSSSAVGKVAKIRDYPDNRPFLAKGTRQKQLSQQDRPLTIDEVRELLNKNR